MTVNDTDVLSILSRYETLESTYTLLPYVVTTLTAILQSGEYDSGATGQARMLLNSLNFAFITALVISHKVMSATATLCSNLQGEALIWNTHVLCDAELVLRLVILP